MKIEIFDPAMCCSTGVCGPSVDPELVRIQETLRQIKKQAPEIEVLRYNLSADPQAFVANATVAERLKSQGPQCLPLFFVNGELISSGRYPDNNILRLILAQEGYSVALMENKPRFSFGCCGPGCC
jgi:hypothetical protein